MSSTITVRFPAELVPILREEALLLLGSEANAVDVALSRPAQPIDTLEVQRHVDRLAAYADILYRMGWDDAEDETHPIAVHAPPAPPELIARIIDGAIEDFVLNRGKDGSDELREALRTIEALERVRAQVPA